jgi:hypothetical protein
MLQTYSQTLDQESQDRDKHSSLLQTLVNYVHKKFLYHCRQVLHIGPNVDPVPAARHR